MNVHRKKSAYESEGKPEQKLDAAYRTNFRISKCSQRSKQKLHINFSLDSLDIYKPLAHEQKVRI